MPYQLRRPTRPRPLFHRTTARSSTAAPALDSGPDMIASGQTPKSVRARTEESFTGSPLTLSPAPSPIPEMTPTSRTTGAIPPYRPVPLRPQARATTTLADAIAAGLIPPPPLPPPPLLASMPQLSPTSPGLDTFDFQPTTPAASYATAARTAATTATTSATPDMAATTSATNPTTTPKPPNRYPPLIVEALPDWPSHFNELKKLLGHAPNGRPFGKGIRFIPKSDQEFRVIQRYLTQLESTTGISWFCYSLPAERSLKVAIRGLPVNTDPALVEQELRELGFSPEHVRAIPARPGRPGCLMFAQLQRTKDTIPRIYEVNELLCMPGIIIEAWRGRKGPAQCHRCQQFRHSSHNCHRPLACVRCGESHLARDCPRPREEPATCANCGGAHPANNAACPAFRREERNRRAGTTARTATGVRADTRPAAPATAAAQEANAPGSLMAAANQPQQQPGKPKKRRRNRGKRAAQQQQQQQQQQPQPKPARDTTRSKPTVVAASDKRTKAKRVAQPQPTTQPARGPVDPRLTAIVGTLNKVLMAIQEQRDPIPLILGCISELCIMYG